MRVNKSDGFIGWWFVKVFIFLLTWCNLFFAWKSHLKKGEIKFSFFLNYNFKKKNLFRI